MAKDKAKPRPKPAAAEAQVFAAPPAGARLVPVSEMLRRQAANQAFYDRFIKPAKASKRTGA